MCEIITIIASIVFTVVYFVQKKQGKTSKAVFLAMLMFWGAALMWSVDGIFSVMEGEGFFDISVKDTILGFIILASGLAVFGGYAFIAKKRVQS
ncbi:MAG: hypothetical protein IIT58_04360 [Treponema sp.]|nr:hypothetical protein [Treponema sp.]